MWIGSTLIPAFFARHHTMRCKDIRARNTPTHEGENGGVRGTRIHGTNTAGKSRTRGETAVATQAKINPNLYTGGIPYFSLLKVYINANNFDVKIVKEFCVDTYSRFSESRITICTFYYSSIHYFDRKRQRSYSQICSKRHRTTREQHTMKNEIHSFKLVSFNKRTNPVTYWDTFGLRKGQRDRGRDVGPRTHFSHNCYPH